MSSRSMRTKSRRQPFSPRASDSSFRAERSAVEAVTQPSGEAGLSIPEHYLSPLATGCLDFARHDKYGNASHNHHMVEVSIKYTGDLHCDAVHGPSQATLKTDAPTDNRGKGEAFSPTDLVATALGTCMSTIMGMKADELGVDLRGMTVSVQKEMSKDAPRRIVGLPSEIHIPLPEKFTASRSARTSRAQLPGAQKFAGGDQSPDKILLGRLSGPLWRFERSTCRFGEQWKRMFPICCR